MHDESSKEDHAGMSETRTGVLEEKDSHDISSEKSGRELHDESSKEDHAGMSETRTGDSEGTDTLSMDSGVSGTLSDNSDGVSGDTKGPPAQEKLLNQNTPAESGNRQVPLLPEQVPNGKVPFASTPALPATGLPIGSAANNSPGTGTPRNKARDENEPFWDPTDSALIMSPWMLLKFWCFLGFRRVLKKNVLENDERSVLYENIVTQPGVDLSQLTEKLSLNKETARYHLKMLAAHGKISGLIKQGIARYFPCREMISEFEKTVIHYLWIGTTKRILMLLIETPGITRQAIASELGIAGPSVTWQMQRLAEDGLIEMRTEGRFVRYFLTTGSFDAIESLRKADRRTAPMLF